MHRIHPRTLPRTFPRTLSGAEPTLPTAGTITRFSSRPVLLLLLLLLILRPRTTGERRSRMKCSRERKGHARAWKIALVHYCPRSRLYPCSPILVSFSSLLLLFLFSLAALSLSLSHPMLVFLSDSHPFYIISTQSATGRWPTITTRSGFRCSFRVPMTLCTWHTAIRTPTQTSSSTWRVRP